MIHVVQMNSNIIKTFRKEQIVMMDGTVISKPITIAGP